MMRFNNKNYLKTQMITFSLKNNYNIFSQTLITMFHIQQWNHISWQFIIMIHKFSFMIQNSFSNNESDSYVDIS